jgi:hypothetical protein
MPNDLQDQLRALVDAAPAVSANEAIARSEAYPSAFHADAEPRRPHRLIRSLTVAASAVVLAGAGIGWALSTRSPTPVVKHGPLVGLHRQSKVILTAAEVKAIATRSTAAAASSGTAEVTQTSAQNGVGQNGYDTAVTFSGQNIDEKITSVPEPPGSSKSFTTDDRFVDGQFYIYTPGPGDVLEWLHDKNSANDAASMQFPDPRALYQAISPGAQFSVDGTTTMNGETVTHLVAGDPSAINASALGNLAADATLTSFGIWVDANDVVQQIALSTSQTNQACQLEPLPSGKKGVVAEPAIKPLENGKSCRPMTTTSNVTVTFANVGLPQSVTAPKGAVDYAGKG